LQSFYNAITKTVQVEKRSGEMVERMKSFMEDGRYIPQGAIKVADKKSDAVAYLYPRPSDGQPCAKVYFGKQSKPVLNAVFGSSPNYTAEQYRAKRIGEMFASRQASQSFKTEQRAKRAAKGRGVEVGSFLASRWGYDQTNVDFYRVEKLIGKTMAEIIKVGAIDVGAADGAASMSSKVVPSDKPVKDAKPMRVVIKDGGAKVKGFYASVWDGMPKYTSWYA
jgi:hypothetical protein